MEKKSPPGFERSYMYTGEEKGGLDPEGGSRRLFETTFPLLLNTYIPNSTTKIQRIFGYTYYTYYDRP